MKPAGQVQSGKQDPLPFSKMAGGGNDFVMIDNRGARIADPNDLARRICTRALSVGARRADPHRDLGAGDVSDALLQLRRLVRRVLRKRHALRRALRVPQRHRRQEDDHRDRRRHRQRRDSATAAR